MPRPRAPLARMLAAILALGCPVIGCLVMGSLALAPRCGNAQTVTAILARGLSQPVSLVTDRWGIPHVRATNLEDLYYAWGWVSARDRLWQMVYTRAAGDGQTHRWLGNSALQADGGAQLFRLRERAHALWERERVDSTVRVTLERYSAGVNAYLASCRRGERPWPPELVRLEERPADWQPEDCYLVLLGFGVTLDLDLSELGEARAVAEHGAAWVKNRRRYEDRWMYDTIPDSAAARLWPEAAKAAATGAALPAEPHAEPRAKLPPALLAAG